MNRHRLTAFWQGVTMYLQLSMRVAECEENGWHDLLSKLDEITQSLIDNPTAGQQIKTALLFWKDAVDCRCKGMPPEENEIILKNPIMNVRQAFGADL
jgi:hypothetical protein